MTGGTKKTVGDMLLFIFFLHACLIAEKLSKRLMKANEQYSDSAGSIFLNVSQTIKIKNTIFHFQPHNKPTITLISGYY